MSSLAPFLPPVLDTISQIVTSKTIPALDEIQRSDVTEYLYKHVHTDLRIQVAEVAYRNHNHPLRFVSGCNDFNGKGIRTK